MGSAADAMSHATSPSLRSGSVAGVRPLRHPDAMSHAPSPSLRFGSVAGIRPIKSRQDIR